MLSIRLVYSNNYCISHVVGARNDRQNSVTVGVAASRRLCHVQPPLIRRNISRNVTPAYGEGLGHGTRLRNCFLHSIDPKLQVLYRSVRTCSRLLKKPHPPPPAKDLGSADSAAR